MENEIEGLEISIQDIIEILLKRLWIIIIATVAGAALLFSYSFLLVTPLYTSTATMYVSPEGGISAASIATALSSLNYSKQVATTYVELMKTNIFLSGVAKTYNDKYGGDYTANRIRDNMTITAVSDTQLMKVAVTDPVPENALHLTEIICDMSPDYILSVADTDALNMADPAVLPINRSNDTTLRNTAIGALLGAFAAAAFAVLFEMFDQRVKSEEDLKKRYDVPVIGGIVYFYTTSDKKHA